MTREFRSFFVEGNISNIDMQKIRQEYLKSFLISVYEALFYDFFKNSLYPLKATVCKAS